MTQSTQAPSSDDVVAALRDAAPVLRENAVLGESESRVPEASIAALEDAGFFKVPMARRHGGYELTVRAMLEASAAVAEFDGGAAWAGTLINVKHVDAEPIPLLRRRRGLRRGARRQTRRRPPGKRRRHSR